MCIRDRRSIPCQATAAGATLVRFAEQLSLLEAEMLGEIEGSGERSTMPLRVPIVLNADSLDSWFLAVFEDVYKRQGVNASPKMNHRKLLRLNVAGIN